MTVEIAKDRISQSQNEKPVFTSVADAKRALASDRLGCVYRSARGVYVVTAFGSGTFTEAEWEIE